MNTIRFSICSAFVFVLTAVSAATGTSTAVAIDLSDSSVFASPLAVGYSPVWNGAAGDAGAVVEIVAVYHDKQEKCSEEVLFTGAADASGVYSLNLSDGMPRAFTLIHRTKIGDAVVGELSMAVSLGEGGESVDEAFADTTAEKLDRVAADKKSAATLAISRSWVEGAASVMLEHIETPVSGEPIVRELYRGTVPASETYTFVPFGSRRSACQCKLHFYDANGTEIGTPLTADYTGRISGVIIVVR